MLELSEAVTRALFARRWEDIANVMEGLANGVIDERQAADQLNE